MPSLLPHSHTTRACMTRSASFRSCRGIPRQFARTFCRGVARRHASAVQRSARRVACSAEAAEQLQRGNELFEANDRMGALRYYENALSQSPTEQQRATLMWNATCVHASFGDVELAQITLRDAVACGLTFDAALQQPQAGMMTMKASTQVIIQLRKFAQAAGSIAKSLQGAAAKGGKRPTMAAAASTPTLQRLTAAAAAGEGATNMGDVIGTDMIGIDTSLMGIVKRVVALLVIGVGGGVALFYLGLKYLFPEV